jgi:putative transposase
MGGHRLRKLSGQSRTWLLDRCRRGEFTLCGLVGELAALRLKVDYRSVWEFVHAERLSHKKDADCQRTGPSRCRAQVSAMAALSPPDRCIPLDLHR